MIKHKEKIKIALIATILIAFTILIVPKSCSFIYK